MLMPNLNNWPRRNYGLNNLLITLLPQQYYYGVIKIKTYQYCHESLPNCYYVLCKFT